MNLQSFTIQPRICKVAAHICRLWVVFVCGSLTTYAEGLKVLPGHLPRTDALGVATGRLASTNQLDLAIGLPLRNQVALHELLRNVYDPASEQFHRYLTPSQFTEKFGPSEKDYQAVVDFARSRGLKITQTHAGRMLLEVKGAAENVENAFQVRLLTHAHPSEARTFYAPDREPSVPLDVPILDVSGLDNFSIPRPLSTKLTPLNAANPRPDDWDGSGPGGSYLAGDLRAAYASNVSADGAGQSVGLVEFDNYFPSDIRAYEHDAGLRAVPLQTILLNGANGVPGNGNFEVALDIEMTIAMAPGLSRVILYEGGGSFNSVLLRMAEDDAAQQLSSSWNPGSGPNYTQEQIFWQMGLQGQSFFQASGDNGAYTNGIADVVDDPYITIVGGTSLAFYGGYGGESVWNNGDSNSVSGGGISTVYPIPTYQQGLDMSANGGSTNWRNSPDVAMISDQVYIRFGNGKDGAAQGTSLASPLWAAFTALINEQAAQNGLPSVGFLNPAIYAIGQDANYGSCFNDVYNGNNITAASPNQFYATGGYDLCTGWGSPEGQALLDTLTIDQANLSITPGNGFAAIELLGSPFITNSESFSLLNTAWLPVSWIVGNIPAWLDVSTNSGTLTPNQAAMTVTISLDPSVADLAPGNYSNAIIFTNLSNRSTQSFPVSLQIVQLGALQVILDPAGAIQAGALWNVDGGPWQTNGAIVSRLYTTTHSINYLPIDGWTPPAAQTVTIQAGETNTLISTYAQQFGSLTVTLDPTQPEPPGGQWQVDGGPWNNFGTTVSGLTTENHTITFSAVSGWDAPAIQTVGINPYQTNAVTADYTELYQFTTIAGSAGVTGSNDEPNGAASFSSPTGVCLDHDGNVFVVDQGNSTIRELMPQGTNWIVTTIAGTAGVTGSSDGTNTSALFKSPTGITIDGAGNLYVTDTGNSTIRELRPSGTNWIVTTIVGLAGSYGWPGGAGSQSRLGTPTGIASDSKGTLWITDESINIACLVSNIGPYWQVQDFDAASFVYPRGVTITHGEGPYLLDSLGFIDALRGINDESTSLYWSSISGYAGVSSPQGIASDRLGNLYVSDTGDHTVRKLTPDALDQSGYPDYIISTIGGLAGAPGSADGFNDTARFQSPVGIAVDANGNLFIADSGNNTIRLGVPPAISFASLQIMFGSKATANESWQVDNGPWQTNGTTVNGLQPGWHQISFAQIPRQTAPGATNLILAAGQNTLLFEYTPAGKENVTLSIKAPTIAEQWTNQVFTMSGTAAANFAVASVWYQINGGGWLEAVGTNQWQSAPTTLATGANLVQAYAMDLAGNISKTNSVRFINAPRAPLTLAINGAGTVSPRLGGRTLVVGKSYTLTAVPARGSDFAGWSGDFSSGAFSLTFTVATNTFLQANFVPNAFTPAAGSYSGIFYNSNSIVNPSSGSFNSRVNSDGTFSARLQLKGAGSAFSGRFNAAGQSSNYIARPINPVSLNMSLNASDGTITGALQTPDWSATLLAYRAGFSKTNSAPQAGRYTLRLCDTQSSSSVPDGFSVGAASIDVSGNVTFTGTLADGTAISQSATISAMGQWPFYASLYSGNESIIGWLSLSNSLTSDVGGKLVWMKEPLSGASLYPAGFIVDEAVEGSAYNFTNGQPILGFNQGELYLTGGGLAASYTNSISWSDENVVADLSAKSLTVSIATASGLFHGKVLNPATGKLVSFSGALLQKQNAGYGFFTGTNQTGRFYLKPSP